MKAILIPLITACCLSACVSSTTTTSSDGTLTNATRTLPERMTDFGIERQILSNLPNIAGLTEGNHRIAIKSYQGTVLLTGEVPSESTKFAVQKMVTSIREVQYLYNFLKVSDSPKSQSHTVHENYLQTKAKAKLLTKSALIKPSQYDIVVRDDIAYVLGVFTPYQENIIKEQLSTVDGLIGATFVNTLITTQTQASAATNATGHYNSAGGYNSAGSYNAAGYNTAGYNSAAPSKNTPSGSTATQFNPKNPTVQNSGSGYIKLYQGTNSP